MSAYFNEIWQTKDVLSVLGGADGKKLRGRGIKATDTDVTDSDKTLDDQETISFPPLSPEAKAISLVKAAILTVPGKGKSATDIEANIGSFTSSGTGVRPAKGWRAKAISGDIYEVTFDFINGPSGEEQAVWSVNVKAGGVKYVNLSAKLFSWTPNY